ncbi:helix-turn-helix domain-containing protein [Collimonas rhizosphaerae]
MTEQEAAELKARVERGDQKAQIARDLGISRNSLYNYLGRRP